MNDEDMFIFLTQILEKLESIDVQLKRLNFRQNNCYEEPPPPVCDPQPLVYYEEPPLVVYDYYEEPPVYYYEPLLDYCYDYYYTDCIYNPYYDYTLDYLIEYGDDCVFDYCYY